MRLALLKHKNCAFAQAAIDAKDAQGDTPLHLAARRAHAGVTEALLSRSAFLKSKLGKVRPRAMSACANRVVPSASTS